MFDRKSILNASWRILLALALFVTLAGPAWAQDVSPKYTEPGWQAAYWNNRGLYGPPTLWRTEGGNLNYDWGTGSPDPRIPVDNFSARWSRYVEFSSGTYRFTATADDGVRVWVDGQIVIDAWRDQPPTTYTGDKYISSGDHMIMVEYYENGGGATIQVSWQLVGQVITDWRGEYFSNIWLSGQPALTRNDAAINFEWGEGSPAWGVIPADYFSVRWTRNLSLAAGNYRFTATADDGVRLWVNGQLIINAWYDQAPRTYTADIALAGGTVAVQMEYYERLGGATAKLSWALVATPPPPAEVVVDDRDAGFVKGGSPYSWNTVSFGGYNGQITWTRNNDWTRPNYNWARWYPSLNPGWYEVYVFIPETYSTTTRANYWISHYNGFTLRMVNQAINGNRWVSLGTYYFRGNAQDYLSLNDVTAEAYLTRLIAWDAAKWVPR